MAIQLRPSLHGTPVAVAGLFAVFTGWSTLPAQSSTSSASTGRATAIKYPATRTVPVVDNYFGTRVADPFRWLEVESPETRRWGRDANRIRHAVPA